MFQWLREYQRYRKTWASVRLTFSPEHDRKAMADLVGMPGFAIIKAKLMSTTLEEIAEFGAKSLQAPGLARAVSIVALCERMRVEIQLEQRAKENKRTPEEQEEVELSNASGA